VADKRKDFRDNRGGGRLTHQGVGRLGPPIASGGWVRVKGTQNGENDRGRSERDKAKGEGGETKKNSATYIKRTKMGAGQWWGCTEVN